MVFPLCQGKAFSSSEMALSEALIAQLVGFLCKVRPMHVSCDFGFHKLIIMSPSRPNDSSSLVALISRLTPLHQTTLLKSDQHKESSFLTGLGHGSYSLSPFGTGMGMVMGFLSHFPIPHAFQLLPIVFELLCRSLLREQYQNLWFPVVWRAGMSWRCLE